LRRIAVLLALVVLASGGAAHAGAGDAAALAAAVRPRPEAAAAPSARARTIDERTPGVAKTAIDHSFAPRDLTGSLGFLCGLQPGAGRTGAAAARGYDPQGRFLGAKLRLAIR